MSGPAKTVMMPPVPETSRIYYTMECLECGIEETCYPAPEPVDAHTKEHNATVHGSRVVTSTALARRRDELARTYSQAFNAQRYDELTWGQKEIVIDLINAEDARAAAEAELARLKGEK